MIYKAIYENNNKNFFLRFELYKIFFNFASLYSSGAMSEWLGTGLQNR